ncbi:GNAT family N-acetyltransferase [Burkholderia pseudomallei]|uniref:Acetyltransferase (GNAT) family protein n=9 Tax=pseudomallei group TaxID=111527 RepID=Q63HV9_BURPS|nr:MULTISPECIES: GNAT family N-acetyltransferase [Burkholderia]KGX77669.1 acetyltransferase family protein [Burkholderia pseudomallei MSHR435]AAY59100.1 acetyltransferase, GNAT family [Burkholderia mallei ATCC 23344]ABA51940.1 acetyltransferase, GNAT family [Burkholderia pseudomallei 1710b]ABM48538.1 acetyltransferase, GNAT family [Burkholderia mallei SAVP1]ABN00216.2 acetyltransferase, GNAT family [Burkholderia mallei NCTC 10229]
MERAATSPPPPDVAIRALRAADADALHALARQPSIDGRFASAPHASLDRRREWLEALIREQYALGAWSGETLVGWSELAPGRLRRSHTAAVAIAVHDAWHRRGVGGALMRETLRIADDWLGLRRIEAQLYADDFVALAFHRRFGFEIEATQRGAALRGGVLVDGCLIARMKAPLPLAAAPGGTPT